MASVILPQFFIPKDSLKLGRFITSIENLHANYHDPKCAEPPKAVPSTLQAYTGVHQAATSSTFGSALTSLLSSSFSRRANTTVRIVADCVVTSVLDNSEGWFEKATKLPETRTWIERQIDQGRRIHLTVGFRTVTNALIVQEFGSEKSAGGQLTVPATLSLAAAGVIVPLGGVLDAGVNGKLQSSTGVQSQVLVPGDQICALQCQRIRHRWLSSNRIDTSRLSRPWWPSIEMWRDEEEGVDDIIEVEMSDARLGEGWDREVVGDEVIFVPSSASQGSTSPK